MPTLQIELDGQPHAVPQGTTLADLLDALQQAPDAVATAVNGAFVAREQRAQCLLAEADKVLLFRAIVGG